MNQIPLIDELAVIAGLGVLVTVLLARVRIPTVTGLLAAGAVLGPFALGLVHSVAAIEILAELGVVLLLFTIGLELPLDRLRHIFRKVAAGALLQVALTCAATALVAVALGEPWARAILYGFIVALSSTAIVLRALEERRELDAPHGRFIVGTLIFQDLCVVPMVLIVPMLARGGSLGGIAWDSTRALAKAGLVVALTLGLSRYVLPRVLRWVAASRSREVFLLAVIGLCIGTAWLTNQAGLSLALGAFLAGMMVADTEYGQRALGDMMPLRDAFVSIFFVSLGMLFDASIVLERPAVVLALFACFLFAKGFLATCAALIMRFPARVAWLAGVGLAQFGEFGFVLARLGEASGVANAEDLGPLLMAGILSMLATPLLVRIAPHFTAGERLLAPLEKLIGLRTLEEQDESEEARQGHVVIAGYGVAGELAAKTLVQCGVHYVALELNAERVRAARAAGEPVFYADASSPEALGHAHLSAARALVLLTNDPAGAQRVIDAARRVAPEVPILARTRYIGERAQVLEAGAKDAVAEEIEGGVEVVSRLLRWLEVPRNVIDERIRDICDSTQTTERKRTLPRGRLGDHVTLADLKIDSVLVRPGSVAAGLSPTQLELRQRTGALVIAVRRGGTLLDQTDASAALQVGDVLYLVGDGDATRKAIALLDKGA